MFKRFSFLFLNLSLLIFPFVLEASDEAFETALQNADSRIEAFDQALQSGNTGEIRRRALELQKDPLAVRRVNESRTDQFKTQLNQELDAIKTETKARVRREIAEKYQVPEEDVTFFEATNPSDEIKVGQDWDVTAQVQGKDVPLEVSTQIVHDSYFEAANGRAPTTPEEATSFAHQQAVEVTNRTHAEAYGSGGKREVTNPKTGETHVMSEGGEIIVGDKSQPMRDSEQLTNVMRHKSEIAKNTADDIRTKAEQKIKDEGLVGKDADAVRRQADADAQAWEMEQARQHTKQQSRQMEPRVAAQGGHVPEQVQRGNAILQRVADGEISPAEGRRQLADIGETPESIIEKGAGLHEAAQKLKSPEERIAQAQALKDSGRDDVLTDNVRERMELNELERRSQLKSEGLSDVEIEQRMKRPKSESLAEVRAKARGAGIDAPEGHLLDGGKSSVKTGSSAAQKLGGAVEALQMAGDTAEVYQQEAEAAAREGRDKDASAVVTEVGRRALGGTEYDTSHKISSDEIAKSDAKGESHVWALGRSLGENARQRFGGGAYDMSQQINQEEAEREVAQAAAEGREASALNAKVNAATRVAGEMTGLRQIGDAVYYDEDADRQMHETQRKVQEKGKGKLQEGILKTGELEDRMNDLIENWDTSDPAIQNELNQLREEYERERAQLQAHLDRMNEGGVVDTNDPEYQALQQAASLVPEYSEEKIQNKVRENANAKMQSSLDQLNCDQNRNMYPLWDEGRKTAYCGCLKGQKPNAEGVCGVPAPEKSAEEIALESVSCKHIGLSEKKYNARTGQVECVCPFAGDVVEPRPNGNGFVCMPAPMKSAGRSLSGSSSRSRDANRQQMADLASSLTGVLAARQQSQSTYQRPTGVGYNGIYSNPSSAATGNQWATNPLYSSSSSSNSGGTYSAGFGQGPVGQQAVENFYGGSSSSNTTYTSNSSTAGAHDLGTVGQYGSTSSSREPGCYGGVKNVCYVEYVVDATTTGPIPCRGRDAKCCRECREIVF